MVPAKVLIPFGSESDKGTHIPRPTERLKERRKHVRYPVSNPVFFSCRKRGDAVFSGEGITRAISLSAREPG